MTNMMMPIYVNPLTGNSLRKAEEAFVDADTGDCYPIIRGIPRFCPAENYSDSFGYQWNRFDRTQLDSHSGASQSYERFYSETGWNPSELSCCSVLEVGSGAGRFSEIFLRTTSGVLHSVDYSSAVDSNLHNNAAYGDRLQLAQASVYALPFADQSFDKVFCLGVLQHTPSFQNSVAALIAKAKLGGEIVVDFYPIKGWHTKIHAKYIVRPVTKRLPKALLLRLIRLNIRWMLALFDLLCLLRLGVLTRFIPITDLRLFPSNLSAAQRREWAVMDTFDGLSPAYDNPQRLQDVVLMFTRNGCEVTFAGLATYPGGSSTVVRAIRRSI
jgi:SAM-dependent methyltransferase